MQTRLAHPHSELVSTKETVGTIERDSIEVRPLRRECSSEFKAALLWQACQTSVSVSGVALMHGLHLNMVQRWPREERRRKAMPQQPGDVQAFVPTHLAPVCDPLPAAEPETTPEVDSIRMESAQSVIW
jgi:transposase-like protein